MIKLNKVIYNKLLLQAQEAKDQGMDKLANSIFEAIGAQPNDEAVEYSYGELKEDIHKDLWKLASKLMYYYDVQSVDAEKVDKTIISWASKLINDLEIAMNADHILVGSLEPSVPGEDK